MMEPAQRQTADQSPLIPLHSLSVITAQVERLKDAPLSRQEINFQSGEVERERGPCAAYFLCLQHKKDK